MLLPLQVFPFISRVWEGYLTIIILDNVYCLFFGEAAFIYCLLNVIHFCGAFLTTPFPFGDLAFFFFETETGNSLTLKLEKNRAQQQGVKKQNKYKVKFWPYLTAEHAKA